MQKIFNTKLIVLGFQKTIYFDSMVSNYGDYTNLPSTHLY
jgi:hypothetical protein